MRIRVTREAKVAVTSTDIRAVAPGEIELPDEAALALIDMGAAVAADEGPANEKSGPAAAVSASAGETPPATAKPARAFRKGAVKPA